MLLAAAAAGLVAFGLWRREVLVLAVHGSTLHRLYEMSPITTTLAMLALAVVFPFGAAFVIRLYLPELEHALRWRRVIRAPGVWHRRICRLKAKQQAVGGSLKMKIEWLEARESEERERYSRFYRLGEHLACVRKESMSLPTRGEDYENR
jgi:hypothetical protein